MADNSCETRLAVHGTLAPGRANFHELEPLGGEWKQGTIKGKLVDAGWGAALGYPGLVLDENASEIEVFLLVSSKLPENWALLDAFEGEGYERVVTSVDLGDHTVSAYVYVVKF